MKHLDQEHIEKIIESLSVVQFRRFVKEYLRQYYKTDDVVITDGSHDGGRDVVVYVNEKQIKKTTQITVQDNIDTKINEDLQKAKDNVESYGFLPQLIFFYSHTVSASKQSKFEQIAEFDYDISLRIIDRKSLASYVDLYPPLESLLKEFLTGLKEKAPRINQKNKIIFDMLTSGGVVNDIKSEFIRTLAQYYIFENGIQPIERVVDYVNCQLNCKIDSSYFLELINGHNSGLIFKENNSCDINESQRNRIIAIKAETSVVQDTIIRNIDEVCTKHNLTNPSAENIFKIISAAYIKVSDLEVENLSSKTNKNDEVINQIIDTLKRQINIQKSSVESELIIKEILSITFGNEYFAKLATTQLFSNLFKQDELEEYIASIPKNIYLDTQILLQIICCLFEDTEYSDFQYLAAKTLLKHIDTSKCIITLHTSYDYIEEVCVHLWDGFAVSEIEKHIDFSVYGQSTNIFYCYYKYLKKEDKNRYRQYSDFIYDLIGVDIYSVISRQDFIKSATRSLIEILKMEGLTIIESPYLMPNDFERLTKEYHLVEKSSKRKPYRAVISDIKMIQYLSDPLNHLNEDTQLYDEPYFITCDSSLYHYRHDFISRYPKRLHWYIYTPLKFANRLSVMNFKPDPEAFSLDLINVAEANFNSSAASNKKNFIDILSMFVGKTNGKSWAISRRITELKNLNLDCSSNVDFTHVRPTEYIEQVLTQMAIYYSKPESSFNMSQLIDLIEDDNYAPQFDKFLEDSIDTLENGGRIDLTILDHILKHRQHQ